MSFDKTVVCSGCQEIELFWSWNFYSKRPILVNRHNQIHQCPSPQRQDIFPGWCEHCKAPELLWLRKQEEFELNEAYGLPHACEQDTEKVIYDISVAKCKYCNATGLFWVNMNAKYILTHPDGVRHTCPEYPLFAQDWAEAKRIDYALTKAWLNSIPDNSQCKKCKGVGTISFLSKNKKEMAKRHSSEPILVCRPCKKCKKIGTFTAIAKKFYLKTLRKKYWPFNSSLHKWKKGPLSL